MSPSIRVDLATLTAEVTAGTLDAEGLRRLEQEAAAAVSAIRREVKRRLDYERREEHAAMFGRRHGADVREVVLPGDPPRPVLVGLYYSGSEVWPVALDPATGQDVRVGWRDLDPSPWGPMWLATTAHATTAHRWDGGGLYACGRHARSLPLPWDTRRSVYDRSTPSGAPLGRPCSACARTRTPDFRPRHEADVPGYINKKETPP